MEQLNQRLPKEWDRMTERFVPDDDWLLWELRKVRTAGAALTDLHHARGR